MNSINHKTNSSQHKSNMSKKSSNLSENLVSNTSHCSTDNSMNIESNRFQDNIDIRVSNEQKNKIYNRRKLLSYNEENETQLITCICCLHELYTYVYYACSHFVCLNCSAKMRVLCKKFDCPICRSISMNVYCTKKSIDLNNFDISIFTNRKLTTVLNQEAGIFCDHDNTVIKYELDEILCNRCDICPKNIPPYNSFIELANHMKKLHRRFYCELCLENLQLFTFERKHYTREELANHKRNGDRDDFSFKGHPLCEYCDERYFDKDELYRHFRKDHYYCHFCDSDGIEEYYKDYNQLRQHFLKKHYLCEMGNCSANASETHEYVVFRTDLDLQVHIKQNHAKTKLEQKNLGKLNIEINLTNSPRDRYKRFNNFNKNNNSKLSGFNKKEQKPNIVSSSSLVAEELVNEDDKDLNERKKVNHENQSQLLECFGMEEISVFNNWKNLIKSKPKPEISNETEFPTLTLNEENKGLTQAVAKFSENSTLNDSLQNYLIISQKKHKNKNFDKDFPSFNEDKSDTFRNENLMNEKIKIFDENHLEISKKNFLKPSNYEQRNKDIESKAIYLFQNFSNNEFQTFKSYSNDFRNGSINANDYLLRSQNLLNLPTSLNSYKKNKNIEKKKLHIEFLDLIQEMLVLLSDVEKQNELFNALSPLLNSLINNDSKSFLSDKKSKWGIKNDHKTFSNNLQNCLFCKQYFSNYEIDSHQRNFHKEQYSSLLKEEISSNHILSKSEPILQEFSKTTVTSSIINENDFPSLSNCNTKADTPIWAIKQIDHKQQSKNEKNDNKLDLNEEFPVLQSNLNNNLQNRISTLPTASIFQNPSSHLSVLNKKKYRFKY